ncbi:MAG: peptide deformylase [Alphaproteobacteria bacterium]|nr:peptide deformylase [Alphaproteobacteria bacterium]
MAKRDIITAPDPRLKVKSELVTRVDDDVRRLLDDMLETMYAAPGIGLAAIQLGIAQRVIVLDIAKENEPKAPLRLINPEIVSASEELQVYDEGCLSLPEQFAEVERPAKVVVRHLDEAGAERVIEAEGLLAVCIQHEMDHLEGVLFVDHISRIKRDMILRKLLKARRLKATG